MPESRNDGQVGGNLRDTDRVVMTGGHGARQLPVEVVAVAASADGEADGRFSVIDLI